MPFSWIERLLLRPRQGVDTVAAEEALRQAYDTDVRPLLAHVRQELGAVADPLVVFR